MNGIQNIEGFSQHNGYWTHTPLMLYIRKNSRIHTRCFMHQEEPCKNAKAKRIEMMGTLHPSQRNILLRKYLKTMKTFNLLDLHHNLAIARGTPKSWWDRLEWSSSRVGHNSTPLNWKTCQVGIQSSVVARRRGSSILIWWKKEIQERPRGMRASLKLRFCLLIHIETSKEVNSTIEDHVEWFLCLKHVLRRFGSLSWLFYSGKSLLGFFCLVACMVMVLDAYAWSKPEYANVCMRTDVH